MNTSCMSVQLNDFYLTQLKEFASNCNDNDDGEILEKAIKSKVADVECLKVLRKRSGTDGFYVHNMLSECRLVLPESNDKFTRSVELEERLIKLKAQQANREYREMTKNVDFGRQKFEEAKPISVSAEFKSINRFLMLFFNTVFTVAGTFVFVYKAFEYALPEPNFAVQLLTGTFFATLVFFADLYFIVKTVS